MKRILILLGMVSLVSCKKDNIDLDSYNYSFFENGYARMPITTILDTYRDKYTPQSTHTIKAVADFRKFKKMPEAIYIGYEWNGGEEQLMVNQSYPADSTKEIFINVYDDVRDSAKVAINVYLDNDTIPYYRLEGMYEFPIR